MKGGDRSLRERSFRERERESSHHSLLEVTQYAREVLEETALQSWSFHSAVASS